MLEEYHNKKLGGFLLSEAIKRSFMKDNVKRVSYSVLYMKAVKALQEAMTRIETLETVAKSKGWDLS